MAGSPSVAARLAGQSPPSAAPTMPVASLDRGDYKFRRATLILLLAVLGLSVIRILVQLTTGVAQLRPWTGALVVLVAGGMLGAAMPQTSRPARIVAATLSLGAISICVAFCALNLLEVPATWFDDLLGPYPLAVGGGSVNTRPGLVTCLLALALAVVTLLLDRASRLAEWTSAALLTLVASLGLLYILQVTTGDERLAAALFRSSVRSTTISMVLTLILVASACLARPRRLPLGPLLATGMAPLVFLAVLGLIGTAFAGRQVHRQLLNGNFESEAADLAGTGAEAVVLLVMCGYGLWYLTRLQQQRAFEVGQDAARSAFANVMLDSAIGLAILNSEGRVQAANPALCQLAQQDQQGLIGRPWWDLGTGGHNEVPTSTESASRVRLALRRPDGTQVWADATITPTRPGSGTEDSQLLAQFVDVTDQMLARDQLIFAARHDPLTGLLNREQIAGMLTHHMRTGPGPDVLVMAIDLDNFKIVNEAFGHTVGDQVLSATAVRIRELAGASGWAGRVGADEFVLTVPLPIGTNTSDPSAILESVMTRLEDPIDVGGYMLRVGVSVGAVISRSLVPERPPGPEEEDPLANASAALRAAKDSGGGRWQMYDDSMRRVARARLHLLNEMNRTLDGLADARFVTWFQPIVNLRTGAVFGYEALARWERSGIIMPAGQWIESAEADALIIHRIAMLSAGDAAEFAATLNRPAHVSVNVSGTHISSRYFAEFVARVTELAAATSPAKLSLEITETALVRISNPVRRMLTGLTDAGVELWVDDFGTGYSSLTHLRDLPISGLKLDQSFVSLLDSGNRRTARRIAGGVAGLANGLRLETIAEGVETRRQADELAKLGWNNGQGWYFGAAEAPQALLERLTQEHHE